MAIQIPNAGTGNGATGDNEFVLWTKVINNFTDQTNAASRLVGTGTGQIPLADDIQTIAFSANASKVLANIPSVVNLIDAPVGFHFTSGGVARFPDTPFDYDLTSLLTFRGYGNSTFQIFAGYQNYSSNNLYMRSGGGANAWLKIYHDKNTTIDAGTGFLKVSSPILHVYNDKIDKIHEAEQLDITVDKKGVGHYEIHGTTGLRQNDGWNMSPPRDIHGNVRCMIEVTEKDGVITVKTYKRKFDLDLAAIVHDYDNPLDIPDGACVELRFNDLPQEILDDIQTEV